MAASKKLAVIITGKADGAIKAFKSTEKAAGGMSSKFKTVAGGMAAGWATMGTAAVAFAVKSANTFKTVGSDVAKLQRLTGLSAESASKLRYEFEATGIKIDAGGRGIAAFSKKLTTSKDTMADFGFKSRDAKGNLLPFNTVLGNASDRLSKMKDGFAKNALAQKLFGKGGLELLKLTNKGSAGMSKLGAEAKKYGLVLTKDNVTAVKKAIKAQREQKAAMEGLQVQIGQHVLPVMTQLTVLIAQGIQIVNEWVRKHWGAVRVIATLGTVIGIIPIALIYAYKHFKIFHNAVDAVVRFIKNRAWPDIKTFARGVALAFQVLAGFVRAHWSTIKAVISTAINAAKAVVQTAINSIKTAFTVGMAAVQGIVAGFKFIGKFISDPIGTARDAVSMILTQIVGFFSAMPGRIASASRGMFDGFKTVFASAVNWIIDKWNGLNFHIPGTNLNIGTPNIGHIGTGGGSSHSGSHGSLPAGGQHQIPVADRSLTGPRRGPSSDAPIIINVAGSVVTERQLADVIRVHAIDRQVRTGRPWVPTL